MYGEKGTDVHTHGNSVTRPLSFQVRERLRVALERCSLLEEELGATHKEVSLSVIVSFQRTVCHFYPFVIKKNEGRSGGHHMLFIFLTEDPPTWVILMTSKLDLWLRAAGSLKYPFVQ